LDRVRLRQANRLLEAGAGSLDAEALCEIAAIDITRSRVFQGGINRPANARGEQ
jgi:hypothetical protein